MPAMTTLFLCKMVSLVAFFRKLLSMLATHEEEADKDRKPKLYCSIVELNAVSEQEE